MMIIGLGCFVMAGAFIGLYGGRSVSFALRSGMDTIIDAIERYGSALLVLERVATAGGLPQPQITQIRQTISDFGSLVLLARQVSEERDFYSFFSSYFPPILSILRR
jgi:hypothetical protein